MELVFSDFERLTGGQWLKKPQNPAGEVVGVCFDTRIYAGQDVFLCLKGENTNGHTFINQLNDKPVRCFIITDAVPLNHPTAGYLKVADPFKALDALAAYKAEHFRGPIVAITGSTGKTSLKYWLAEVLAQYFSLNFAEKSYNNHLGCPTSLMALHKNHQICLLEMGANHVGEIERLARVARPNMSVITNVGMGHIGKFGSLSATKEAKSEIFRHMRSPAIAFLSSELADMPTHEAQHKVIYEEIYRVSVEPIPKGTDVFLQRVKIHTPKTDLLTHTHLLGAGLPKAFSAIVAICDELKFPMGKIPAALRSLKPIKGRLFLQRGLYNSLVVDDSYNANPNSFIHLAQSIQHLTNPYKIIILGDMAELDGYEEAAAEYIVQRFPTGIDELLVYGNFADLLVKKFQRALVPSTLVKKFPSQTILAQYLEDKLTTTPSPTVLAFKGSRVTRIEALLEKFLAE